MRTEVKIGLGLFAMVTALKHFFSVPEFFSGLSIGLSLFFMIFGLFPENFYQKVKRNQTQKLSYLKKILRINQ